MPKCIICGKTLRRKKGESLIDFAERNKCIATASIVNGKEIIGKCMHIACIVKKSRAWMDSYRDSA